MHPLVPDPGWEKKIRYVIIPGRMYNKHSPYWNEEHGEDPDGKFFANSHMIAHAYDVPAEECMDLMVGEMKYLWLHVPRGTKVILLQTRDDGNYEVPTEEHDVEEWHREPWNNEKLIKRNA